MATQQIFGSDVLGIHHAKLEELDGLAQATADKLKELDLQPGTPFKVRRHSAPVVTNIGGLVKMVRSIDGSSKSQVRQLRALGGTLKERFALAGYKTRVLS